jgi:hypothetical protein
MNRKRLNKLCDRTLKALVSGQFKEPIKYETNDLDDKVTLTEDFFKEIKISEVDVPFVVNRLEKNNFIETSLAGGGRNSVDRSTDKLLVHKINRIRITQAGIVFIKSTSFWFESLKDSITKWIPITISLIAIAITFAFNYISCNRGLKQQEINKQVEGLNDRIDSLVSTIQAKKFR